MSHTPHDLAEEFPAEAARIAELKESDAHFSKLVEEYNQVNQAVYRAENRIDTVSEEHEEALRRQRARLKDSLWAIIRKA
ncbi:YdcH family protein [Pseudogemmobacter blasticus]|uniref:DUF465 domain-containing protein n=1 Tax=Fuscovulum blasticum DSM 2131 TaxID=1188250 RepID=A0A2T4J8M7_FUSBL|nr:DUF465 domain-containing protein [Fuscovulum blasticum]PTE14266.1 hypothetical protein C5F44_09695 [Fuscovulum blasticum DSM 2131]